jgi:hypothetical protein
LMQQQNAAVSLWKRWICPSKRLKSTMIYYDLPWFSHPNPSKWWKSTMIYPAKMFPLQQTMRNHVDFRMKNDDFSNKHVDVLKYSNRH